MTTIVDRTPEVVDEAAPEAIVVLSNADDRSLVHLVRMIDLRLYRRCLWMRLMLR